MGIRKLLFSDAAATASSERPVFHGEFGEISVGNSCNASTCSRAHLKFTYVFLDPSHTMHTALDGDKLFTGSVNFQVKEIEVFEITD
jgi:hypothetical protein